MSTPLDDDQIRDYEMTAVDAAALMIQGTRGYILATHVVPDLIAEVRRLHMTGGREDVTRALAELLREWRQTCEQMGIPYTDEDAAAFAAEAYPLNRLSDERLAQAEAQVPKPLADALVDLFWRAVPYGETADGDTAHYLFTKGTVHRLIGQAQSAGVPAVFRSDGSEHMPDTDERATLAEGWGFGLEAAASLVAATSWPWERREDRDEWSVRLISEPDLLAQEARRARVRLESAIAALSDDAAPRVGAT